MMGLCTSNHRTKRGYLQVAAIRRLLLHGILQHSRRGIETCTSLAISPQPFLIRKPRISGEGLKRASAPDQGCCGAPIRKPRIPGERVLQNSGYGAVMALFGSFSTVIFVCSAKHEPQDPLTGRLGLSQWHFAVEDVGPTPGWRLPRQALMRIQVIATGSSKLIQRLMLKAMAFILAWKSALSFPRRRARRAPL